MTRRTPTFLLAACLAACTASPASDTWQPWQPIDSDATTARLTGVWQNEALGHIARVSETGTEVFHDLGPVCMADTGVVPAFALARFGANPDRVRFAYYDYRETPALLQNPLEYTRRSALPDACQDQAGFEEMPLIELFDLITDLFERHYAFFDERRVDWTETRARFGPLAAEVTSEEALFDLLEKMLTPLNDGHLNLTWETRAFNAGRPKLLDVLGEAWEATDQAMTRGAFVGDWSRTVQRSVHGILNEGTHQTAAEGALEWGIIGGNVGYVRINRFNGFLKDAPSRQAELAALRQMLTEMSADLEATDRLILDVSHNGGGNDAAAMTVVQHFLDRPRHVLTYAVSGTPDRVVELAPTRITAQKPILLLTSEVTASAAEAFVLMMRALPHVEHVGMTTRGSISSLLPKPLPRGFQVTLSYQQVLDADGNLYEAKGIPPTRPLPLFADDTLFTGYAAMIAALAETP